MGIFGLDPIGAVTSPFGGVGLISVLSVLPVSNNSVSVVFDTEPKTLDPQAGDTATNPNNYTLIPIDPTYTAADGSIHVPEGEVVPTRTPLIAVAEQDDIDPNQIIVSFDSAVEPHVRYTLVVSSLIKGEDSQAFSGPSDFNFRAPLLSPRLVRLQQSEERFRDFDWIINPKPGEAGQVFRNDDTGDIAIQNASTSLRKRIYRRVFTNPKGLAWKPDYGVGVRVKALAKARNLQEVSNIISDQIRKEPDVLNVGVEVFLDVTSQGAFLSISARVQQRDSRTQLVQFREPL